MANLQSRYVNCKSVASPSVVVAKLQALYPQAAIVWAVHDMEDPIHTHYVVRFQSVTRWNTFREWLMRIDPHSYSAPARSWQRSIRYLLHLDNPEKPKVPRENLHSENIDDSELSMLLGAPKSAILADIASIGNRNPFEAFEYLVCTKGHQPSEVSAAIRCLIDLERFRTEVKRFAPVPATPETTLEDSIFNEVFGQDPLDF